MQQLLQSINWRQQYVRVYGRTLPSPRLTAWHGDPGKRYSYSGVRLEPQAWTKPLNIIKHATEELAAVEFNSVLLNLYRDGNDSVGWHSDSEKTLGNNPPIASVSLGATRRFHLQHKKRKTERVSIDLEHNSLLLMLGPTQHHWRHCVLKTRVPTGPRINLTFRRIVA